MWCIIGPMIKVIDSLFTIYTVMLLVRILSSWIPEFSKTRVIQFISFYTDPYLNFFRKIIPPLGMIDISPILAFLALQFAEGIILRLMV